MPGLTVGHELNDDGPIPIELARHQHLQPPRCLLLKAPPMASTESGRGGTQHRGTAYLPACRVTRQSYALDAFRQTHRDSGLAGAR